MHGLRVGSFTLEHPLAAGGMGEVWRATHRSGAPVALKIISAQAPDELDPVAALQAEIRAIAALQHPNIVPVHDAGVLGPEHEGMSGGTLVAGSPWLAMELAEGSVHDLLPGLDWPLLLQVLIQILDGLAHAHARGVIHRDLKPANVLYTRASGQLRIMVADFGLAWAWRAPSQPLDGGTAAYSAPEQLLGQLTEQGPWTDLYALGGTAFRMITGRRPYRGQTAEELQRAHLFADIPRLTARFSIPRGLEPWFEALMEKDPHKRFQRASDAAWSLMQLPAPGEGQEAIDEEDDIDTVSVLRSGRASTRTLPVEAWAQQAVGPGPAPEAALVRPPVPAQWARPQPQHSRLPGRGLGLFGMAETPVVARTAERDRLWEALAQGDHLQLAIVDGARGIGKSRLGAWLCERAHEVGAAEVFRASFQHEDATTGGLAALIEEQLRTHGMSGAEVLKHLELMVKLDGGAGMDPASLARLLRPDDPTLRAPGDQDTRLELTWRVMRRRAVGRRLLVWLDDVHRGTDALALAQYLAQQAPQVPGLILLTLDPEPLPAASRARLDELRSALPTVELHLQPLARREVARLVRAMLPVPDRLARRIAEASGGSPLATVQLVADLVQRGQLRGDATGVEVDPRVPLPDSLTSLFDGALERLAQRDPADRRALEVAAFLGTTVTLPEWREAAQRVEVDLDPRRLSSLVAGGFVSPVRGGGRYTFGSSVIRDALLEAAGREGRAALLHRVCGETLLARGDARAAGGGDHLAASGQHGRAAEAYLQAMRWLAGWDRERALELGARWHASLRREAPPGDPRWAEGKRILVELLGIEGGDAHQRATVELLERGRGDPQAEARALIELTHADLRAAELTRAGARAELAWRRAQGTELRAEAGAARAEVRRHRGDLLSAEALLRSALQEDRDATPLILALARVLSDDDRAHKALRLLRDWSERVPAPQAPLARARVLRAKGTALLARGRAKAAAQALEQACLLRDQGGFGWPVLDLDLAAALVATGKRAGAAELLDGVLEQLDATRDARHRADALSLQARLALDADDQELLESCVDELEDLPAIGRRVSTTARLGQLAEAAGTQGEIALARRLKRLIEPR